MTKLTLAIQSADGRTMLFTREADPWRGAWDAIAGQCDRMFGRGKWTALDCKHGSRVEQTESSQGLARLNNAAEAIREDIFVYGQPYRVDRW